MSESEIVIKVGLDEHKMPKNIRWKSTDNPENSDFQECKAFLLSMFDKESKETLRIDLWTNEMQVAEMDRLMYFTLKGLSETYFRATSNSELANHFRQFAEHFGEKTNIIEPPAAPETS